MEINRRAFAKTFALLAIIAVQALGLCACDDPRSTSEILSPWADKIVPLSPQGPRASDHALLFTSNLEFVVIKKLESPQKVCRTISGDPDTATVQTTVPEENCIPQPDGSSRCDANDAHRTREIETEVSIPGESRTLCEDQDTMDMPRTSRVVAVVHSNRPGVVLDPAAVQELALGIHASDLLKQTIPEGELEASLSRLRPEDETLVGVKATGYRLASVQIRLGRGHAFKPGDDILIDATVEGILGGGFSVLGSPVALPHFREAEGTPAAIWVAAQK